MPETKTAGGNIERGRALQRHFVREIETVDGVMTVTSFSTNHVKLGLDAGVDIGRVVDVVEDHDGVLEFSKVKGSYRYSTGHISVNVVF